MMNDSRRSFLKNGAAFAAVGAVSLSTPTLAIAGTRAQKGKLTAANGRSFPFTYSSGNADGLTVVYLGGMGGNGNEVSRKARDFTGQGLNLMTFDRAEPKCRSTQDCVAKVAARVPGGTVMSSSDGSPTAADDIMANELSSVFSFVTNAPGYNPAKGIVLIGGSYGSWLSLVAASSSFKKHIKGAVFLSPAIAPEWFEGPEAAPSNMPALRRLSKAFGTRPAIAIGSDKDLITPDSSSTLASAQFLSRTLLAHPRVIDSKSPKHASKLLTGSKSVRRTVVQWISSTF